MLFALVVKWISCLPSKQLLGVRIPPSAQKARLFVAEQANCFACVGIRKTFLNFTKQNEKSTRDGSRESLRAHKKRLKYYVVCG